MITKVNINNIVCSYKFTMIYLYLNKTFWQTAQKKSVIFMPLSEIFYRFAEILE